MRDRHWDWQKYLDEGREYHRACRGAVTRPEIFTPEILRHLAALAVEKYFIAALSCHGILPRGHTMTDLLEELRDLAPEVPLPPDLETAVRGLDAGRLCSLDPVTPPPAVPGDAPRFLDAVDQAARFTERVCAP